MGMTVDFNYGKRIDPQRISIFDFARMLANICWSGVP